MNHNRFLLMLVILALCSFFVGYSLGKNDGQEDAKRLMVQHGIIVPAE